METWFSSPFRFYSPPSLSTSIRAVHMILIFFAARMMIVCCMCMQLACYHYPHFGTSAPVRTSSVWVPPRSDTPLANACCAFSFGMSFDRLTATLQEHPLVSNARRAPLDICFMYTLAFLAVGELRCPITDAAPDRARCWKARCSYSRSLFWSSLETCCRF